MPGLSQAFVTVVAWSTAGDPCDDHALWTHLTREEMAMALEDHGYGVSVTVVDRLLDEHGMSQRKAVKSKAMGETPDRDAQFQYIAKLRQQFEEAGNPILSIDTKKREVLGDFARPGRTWCAKPLRAWDHDYPSHATGVLIPQGILDLVRNEGYLTLGVSHATSDFAGDCLWNWWTRFGRRFYPYSDELLLLCDSGGSNGCRLWRFKEVLQLVSDRTGLIIRVAHYPSYCSKYNPIDHRLFPHVTRCWKGVLLRDPEYCRDLLPSVLTDAGLELHVRLSRKEYPLKVTASDEFLVDMPIKFDSARPRWNYRVLPRMVSPSHKWN